MIRFKAYYRTPCVLGLILVWIFSVSCRPDHLETAPSVAEASPVPLAEVTSSPVSATRVLEELVTPDEGFVFNARCGSSGGGVEVLGSFEWTSDGRFLLAETSRKTYAADWFYRYFALVDVEHDSLITSDLLTLQGDEQLRNMALSSDQQFIAQTLRTEQGYELRVKGINGESSVVYTSTPDKRTWEARWISEDKNLVFMTSTRGEVWGSLNVLDLESGKISSVVNNVMPASWSVGGDWLVGLHWLVDTDDLDRVDLPIFLYNLKTGESLQIDMGRCISDRPQLSPDREYVVFSDSLDHQVEEGKRLPLADNREIYIMRLDGSDLTNVTGSKGADDDPTWSPDGESVVYTSYGEVSAEGQEICLVSIMENVPQCITDTPDIVEDAPKWSPNGEWIAFLEEENEARYLSIIRPDGSDRTRLVSVP